MGVVSYLFRIEVLPRTVRRGHMCLGHIDDSSSAPVSLGLHAASFPSLVRFQK